MPWLLPVTAALVVLTLLPHTLFSFDVAPKVILLMTGLAAALAVTRRPGIAGLLRTQRGKWFAGVQGLLVVSLVISTCTSLDPNLSLFGTAWRRFGLLSNLCVLAFGILLAAESIRDSDTVPRFLKASSIAGLVAAVYGICQYLGIDPILPASAYHVGEGVWAIVRPPGTLGHASYFATFLLYAGFASLALARLKIWRTLAYASAALCGVAIVLSGTRAAMLGLALGFVILFFERRPKFRAAHLIGAVALVTAGAGFYISPLGERLRARTRWSQEDATGGARMMLWRDSLAMSAKHPVFGYGPEVFTTEFPRHQSLELARVYPDFYQESPHNVFLDMLAAQGIPGLAAFAALCVLALKSYHAMPWSAPLAAGFAAGLMSQQFGVFTVPTAMYFYALAAILATAGLPHAIPRPLPALRFANAMAAAGLVWLASQFGASEYFFGRAREQIVRRQIEAAIDSSAAAKRWAPGGSTYDLYFSRAWLQLSESLTEPAAKFQTWQNGMAAASRASSDSDDRANALVNLAAFQASLNNASAVERTLLAAVARAPNWFRPHWLLARLYLATGHIEQAEAHAALAVERNGDRNREVRDTLDQVRAARIRK